MSARGLSQVPTNALYVASAAHPSSIKDATGAASPSWVTAALCAAGAVYRDMGKTVYLPAPTTPSAVGAQSTILRKVQLVPAGAAGLNGTGGAAGAAGSEFFTGYIPIGGQTYGGGVGGGTPYFARAN